MTRIFVPLEVDYYDDEKVIAAGEQAELLYVRALCLAKRRMTDGRISVHQLPLLRVRNASKLAGRLVEVGLWSVIKDGWHIQAWSKHNKSRAAIEERSDQKRRGAIAANHQRHHVNEGKFSPDCDLCLSQNGSQNGSQVRSTEAKAEAEAEPRQARPPGPQPGRSEGLPPAAAEALAHIIEHRHDQDRAAGRIRNEQGWQRSVPASITDEHTPTLLAVLRNNPSSTAHDLVTACGFTMPVKRKDFCGSCNRGNVQVDPITDTWDRCVCQGGTATPAPDNVHPIDRGTAADV